MGTWLQEEEYEIFSVTVALKEYAAGRKAREFEEAMAQMARDPAIRSESAAISREFAVCETDGLTDD